eukprot:870870-Rhodomonas_salina.1
MTTFLWSHDHLPKADTTHADVDVPGYLRAYNKGYPGQDFQVFNDVIDDSILGIISRTHRVPGYRYPGTRVPGPGSRAPHQAGEGIPRIYPGTGYPNGDTDNDMGTRVPGYRDVAAPGPVLFRF